MRLGRACCLPGPNVRNLRALIAACLEPTSNALLQKFQNPSASPRPRSWLLMRPPRPPTLHVGARLLIDKHSFTAQYFQPQRPHLNSFLNWRSATDLHSTRIRLAKTLCCSASLRSNAIHGRHTPPLPVPRPHPTSHLKYLAARLRVACTIFNNRDWRQAGLGVSIPAFHGRRVPAPFRSLTSPGSAGLSCSQHVITTRWGDRQRGHSALGSEHTSRSIRLHCGSHSRV